MAQNIKESLVNSLRMQRRSAGLSQTQLGQMLGYSDETAVAKHEHFESIPPFLTALGYEAIFQIHASKLFAGLKETVAIGVELRVSDFERNLRARYEASPSPELSRTLEWLEERRANLEFFNHRANA